MRQKKKTNNTSRGLVSFAIGIIIFIVLMLFSKTDYYNKIEQDILVSNLAQDVINIKNANIEDIIGNIAVNNQIKTVNEDATIINSVSNKINIENDKLNILFFDVGQADSELIIVNGKTILIDAGNLSDGDKLVSGIKGLGIEKLDYVFGTHVHEDHMGGMSKIVEAFEIGEFYMPYDTVSTTSYYKKLLSALSNKNISVNEAEIGDIINIDNASLEIMSVNNDNPENINLQSIVLELRYETQKYLFMGDAEIENEKQRKWNDVDLIKVGHHGSNTSSSEEFIKEVLPEIAIIEVGKDNSYNLPKDKIIKRYEEIGSKIYRTDEDGTIQVISDGTSNEIIKVDMSFDGKK